MTIDHVMECGFKVGDVVTANYTFKKDKNEDLPFNKNETLKIINIGKDPNWAHAKNTLGETGLIPLNYVQRKESALENIQDHCWYHGRISRAESESLLSGCPIGSFLIRESDLYSGGLTLCVVGPSCMTDNTDATDHQSSTDVMTNVQHYRIVRRPFKPTRFDQCFEYPATPICSKIHYTLDETDWFSSLLELVQFYSQPKRGLVCALLHPVPDMQRKRLCRLQKFGYLIFRKEIVLGDRIGRGEFGEVLKATYHGRQVAVKIYKKTASKLAITYEASLMTKINHPNLVSFIGLVYEPDDAVYLVTEYLANGSLLTYLHSRTRDEITELTKLKFSTDVCCGLVYLEERDFIHRDIAARNVLLSGQAPNLIAKVADFGMARDLHDLSTVGSISHQPKMSNINNIDSNNINSTIPTLVLSSSPGSGGDTIEKYSKTDREIHRSNTTSPTSLNPMVLHDNGAIPLKWTAPEAVRDRLFTTKSDVWSFGILLWEIYSYGRIPYPRMMASQVLRHIESGYRMKSPEDCPSTIYALMLRTWQNEPSNRPSFAEILKELIALDNTASKSPVVTTFFPSANPYHPNSGGNSAGNSSVLEISETSIDCDKPLTTWGTGINENKNVMNNYHSTTCKLLSDRRENRLLLENKLTDVSSSRHVRRPKTLAELISEPLHNSNQVNKETYLLNKSPNRTMSTMSRSFTSTTTKLPKNASSMDIVKTPDDSKIVCKLPLEHLKL